MELIRQLTESASVVLLAAPERQKEVIGLIAEGDLEFVARVEDFIPLAASLVERRLRWAGRSESSLGAPWAGMPEDIAEIFRHEINNPLTGIWVTRNCFSRTAHGCRPWICNDCKLWWSWLCGCVKQFAASATRGKVARSQRVRLAFRPR